MPKVQRFTGRGALGMAIRKMTEDLAGFPKAMRRAATNAALATVPAIKRRVPVASAELKDSIHVEETDRGPRIVADAPHAAFVEYGTRPHTPPIGPILEWVKLRGMQGLTSAGHVISNRTRTGKLRRWQLEPARVVAGMLAQQIRGGASPADAPYAVARAIQQKIAKYGTRPQPFMRSSIPDAVQALDLFVKEELRKL